MSRNAPSPKLTAYSRALAARGMPSKLMSQEVVIHVPGDFRISFGVDDKFVIQGTNGTLERHARMLGPDKAIEAALAIAERARKIEAHEIEGCQFFGVIDHVSTRHGVGWRWCVRMVTMGGGLVAHEQFAGECGSRSRALLSAAAACLACEAPWPSGGAIFHEMKDRWGSGNVSHDDIPRPPLSTDVQLHSPAFLRICGWPTIDRELRLNVLVAPFPHLPLATIEWEATGVPCGQWYLSSLADLQGAMGRTAWLSRKHSDAVAESLLS